VKKNFKIIGFDADDTLWVNEPYFQQTQRQFCELLSSYHPKDYISKELYKTEIRNLDLYGFGTKSFMLSMIETALKLSDYSISNTVIEKIIRLGKEQLRKPVTLLEGIEETLEKVKKNGYQLIVVTKGDLLDQERKLYKSNISQYFHHIEIMSDKKEANYSKLLNHLNIAPEDFLMIGNSMKSDIIPVINIGGYGVYIPYHITWAHEEVEPVGIQSNYWQINHIGELDIILNLGNN
jgi:putative hydrolase of the HAD superfamily